MASYKVFGFDGYKIAEYNNITNNDIFRLHEYYREQPNVYSTEKNYD